MMMWRWQAIRHARRAPQRMAMRVRRASLVAGTQMASAATSAALATTALEALAPRVAAVLVPLDGSVSVAVAMPTAAVRARAGVGAEAQRRSVAAAGPVWLVVTAWVDPLVPHATVPARSAAMLLPAAMLAES